MRIYRKKALSIDYSSHALFATSIKLFDIRYEFYRFGGDHTETNN